MLPETYPSLLRLVFTAAEFSAPTDTHCCGKRKLRSGGLWNDLEKEKKSKDSARDSGNTHGERLFAESLRVVSDSAV